MLWLCLHSGAGFFLTRNVCCRTSLPSFLCSISVYWVHIIYHRFSRHWDISENKKDHTYYGILGKLLNVLVIKLWTLNSHNPLLQWNCKPHFFFVAALLSSANRGTGGRFKAGRGRTHSFLLACYPCQLHLSITGSGLVSFSTPIQYHYAPSNISRAWGSHPPYAFWDRA